ncbi:O-antigen ligase family protein [Ideonella sp. YS5]|uniref:O-antigen ligase family protein n=1 Tax=Ideonella sp. YS5 TaxID=3453714 RepID=UPI003EE861CF
MSPHLKPLPIILATALLLFWIAGLAWPEQARKGEIGRLRWAFLIVTTLSFVSPSIWVYTLAMPVVVLAFMLPARQKAERAAILWALLLLAVPNLGAYIPGFGSIGNFFEMTHSRALTFALLLPAMLGIGRGPRQPGPLGVAADWFVLAYFGVQLAVMLPYASRTDLIRQAFVLGVDTLLPYWVFSRAFTTPEGLRSALRAYVLVAMVLSLLAMFESVRRWPLYDAVPEGWNIDWDMNVFLERAGFLRAKASAGHSLMFGCVLVLGLGFWGAIKNDVRYRALAWLGTLALVGGLAASLARGSWLGAALMFVLLIFLGEGAGRRLVYAVVGGIGIVAVASLIPALHFVVDMLPFVGHVDSENVEYRQRLLEISLGLIANSPWLGVPGYLNYMEELRQGQGIIDIVNSYLGIALTTGVVGLACFVGIFLATLSSLWRLRGHADASAEGRHMANYLIATTIALLFVLVTTSSIVVVLQLTYMLAGLSVSCARLYMPERGRLQPDAGPMAGRPAGPPQRPLARPSTPPGLLPVRRP